MVGGGYEGADAGWRTGGRFVDRNIGRRMRAEGEAPREVAAAGNGSSECRRECLDGGE